MPNLAVLQRRERVKQLIVQGKNYTEIAQVLKVNYWTVLRDLAAVQKETVQLIRKNPMEKLLGDFVLAHDTAQQKAWELFERTEEDRVKVQCLGVIQRLLESKVKVLQSLGIVHPEVPNQDSVITLRWGGPKPGEEIETPHPEPSA